MVRRPCELFVSGIWLLADRVRTSVWCACARTNNSNIYYINDKLDKRTWTYIFGACCATTVFIPSFHNYRIWSFLGLVMTTYTAWYLAVASLIHGQVHKCMIKQAHAECSSIMPMPLSSVEACMHALLWPVSDRQR
jgi:hypothetical protein